MIGRASQGRNTKPALKYQPNQLPNTDKGISFQLDDQFNSLLKNRGGRHRLKNPPELRFRNSAHGSISIQERQPIKSTT